MADHKEAIVAVIRAFFAAQVTGDKKALAAVTLPHPQLDVLVPPPPDYRVLTGFPHLQVDSQETSEGHFFARAFVNGTVQLFVVRATPQGLRIDPRYAIDATREDDEQRRVARRFYLALLTGDVDTMRELSFDARGVELLAEGGSPPAGEHGQLEHVASMVGFTKLEQGEPFQVPTGVRFVEAQHREHGIEVYNALTPDGEIPFLLRRRDGAWKVIPFHFIQAVVQARGGTMGS